MNKYQKVRADGRLGSPKDPTWDKKRHMHTCCKSIRSWYHKISCPTINANFDIKTKKISNISKLHLKISELRLQGKNSSEIAKILSMPLFKVNSIFDQLP